MEDNAPEAPPQPCTAGCGFYGNKIYNNMCSKCFKEQDERNKKEEKVIEPPVEEKVPDNKEPVVEELPELIQQDIKPIQKNKGRCFSCRSKIPLSKQLTNKCRCEYIFCDTHRFPDKHQCDFDHATMDKDILAKNNPKLNEKPRGGNSFQRIDSL
ncbi:hypothetical protein K501DRAFT_321664 [Backusella circina FSU 941]|nr:hypothetical protein K501DRAFT_321664 [Backusella circina FSU 941]